MDHSWDVEGCLKCIWKRISANMRAAFFSAIIVGFVAHIPIISRVLFNHDDSLSEGYWLTLQGKWFSDTVYRLDAGYYTISLAIITGIMALALSAALIVDALDIRSRLWSACVGAAMVSFPSVMTAFAHYVGFWDVFLLVLPLWLVRRFAGWRGGVLAIIPLTLGLGVYPPFLSVTAAGFLILCMEEALRKESTIKTILARAFSLLGILLAGVGGYYAVLQICLQWQGIDTYNYYNVDTMAQIDWTQMPRLCYEAVKDVFKVLIYDWYGTTTYHIKAAYRLTLIFLVIAVLFVAWARGLFRKPGKLALYLVFVVLSPLAVHLVYPLSKGMSTHWIMRYPFVFIFIGLFKLCDEILRIVKENAQRPNGAKTYLLAAQQWCCFALAVLLVYNWTVFSHEGYLRMQVALYGAVTTEARIVSDIYDSPAYEPDAPVALIGLSEEASHQDVLHLYDSFLGVQSQHFIFSYEGTTQRFMQIWLNPDFTFVEKQKVEELRQTEEFAAMSVYPQHGYVQVIDGVIVAKLSE